ncbi:MAG TPA: DegT/DnrJ/EryC1/StrS family aminotransferase [Desulfuromonadaceae bacterium]
MSDVIPVNEPLLDGNEKAYLLECIETGWISSEGPFVTRFEELFAAKVGRAHGIAVANGSGALDIAVQALRLGPGDEVILPTFTIISCAAAIVRAGATPVVVDAEPSTWNMDVRQLERAITPRTKAIMAVHIYGLPTDMTQVLEVADRHGLRVIEDAAQMHGQTCSGRPCGSFGDISTFSFYPNKHITTGEGGMVLTNDPTLAERCRGLRNLCFQAGKRFVHEELGWNYRMTNMQAALGVAQVERLDYVVRRKRAMGKRYNDLLRGMETVELPLERTGLAENIYWVYGVVLKDEVPYDAEQVMKRLATNGIGTRPFFWSMHEQPVFRKMGLFDGVVCPVAERLARRGFYLPSGLALTDPQMTRVAAVLREVLQ